MLVLAIFAEVDTMAIHHSSLTTSRESARARSYEIAGAFTRDVRKDRCARALCALDVLRVMRALQLMRDAKHARAITICATYHSSSSSNEHDLSCASVVNTSDAP